MKSFAIKRDENDSRWKKFIEWGNDKFNGKKNGLSDIYIHYGIDKTGEWNNWSHHDEFDRIITLDEWESEFMKPQLAGREYDEKLLDEWLSFEYNSDNATVNNFINHRYAKQDRVTEIKAQIEKLSNELKELEG